MTNYDKIVLEVGLMVLSLLMRRYVRVQISWCAISPCSQTTVHGSRTEKPPLSSMPIPAKIYDTPIEELDLSVRAYNCLKRSNITKVGQVLSMNEEDLLGVRNFGEKSLQELRERLLVTQFLANPRTSAVGADMDGDHEMEE